MYVADLVFLTAIRLDVKVWRGRYYQIHGFGWHAGHYTYTIAADYLIHNLPRPCPIRCMRAGKGLLQPDLPASTDILSDTGEFTIPFLTVHNIENNF